VSSNTKWSSLHVIAFLCSFFAGFHFPLVFQIM
jgi:hypothetical protein